MKKLKLTNGKEGKKEATIIVFPKKGDLDTLICIRSRKEEASVYIGKDEIVEIIQYLKKQL